MPEDLRTRITREVAEEWAAEGRLHVPPDEVAQDDDDLAFWAEVEHRLALASDGSDAKPDEPSRRSHGGETTPPPKR